MKPTADFDKEALRWSLSWHPEDRCGGFTREAILASAPPASGVYGLFNFDCQLFIGEADNIQEVLLRLESEPDFHSSRLRPTGFAFELCPPELRKARAEELIATFQPVLQTEGTLGPTWSAPHRGTATGSSRREQEAESGVDRWEFPVHEREKQSKALWHGQWMRSARLAAVLAVGAVAVFYLGAAAVKNIQTGASAAGGEPLAQLSVTEPDVASKAGPQTPPSIDRAAQGADPAQTDSKVYSAAASPHSTAHLAAKVAASEHGAAAQPPAKLPEVSSDTADQRKDLDSSSSKKWSVQISAAPTKNTAVSLAQRLKAHGYDGYVVPAEVKGQTYYRVRVGPFTTRDEAESARQSLAAREDFRDAFLTGD